LQPLPAKTFLQSLKAYCSAARYGAQL